MSNTKENLIDTNSKKLIINIIDFCFPPLLEMAEAEDQNSRIAAIEDVLALLRCIKVTVHSGEPNETMVVFGMLGLGDVIQFPEITKKNWVAQSIEEINGTANELKDQLTILKESLV